MEKQIIMQKIGNYKAELTYALVHNYDSDYINKIRTRIAELENELNKLK